MSGNVIVPGKLNARDLHEFEMELSAQALEEIARDLDLLGLKKVRFKGVFKPVGKNDWQLKANLGATVTQSCVVTLEPVNTRIDEVVERTYLLNFDEPEEAEVEMGEDETQEQLPKEIDLSDVFSEALSLSLPVYPKKEGAELAETIIAEPGIDPLTDEDVKPFAGLKDLRDKMAKK